MASAWARSRWLPFENFSGDASQDYLVDGITEALIADLARTRGLRVTSRTSSMYYKGQRKSMPDIAAELGVDLLVEGSVARAGNRVRVTAQLINGPRDEHIWARTYDHTVDDVLALQNEIATAIAGEIRGAIPGASGPTAARRAISPQRRREVESYPGAPAPADPQTWSNASVRLRAIASAVWFSIWRRSIM